MKPKRTRDLPADTPLVPEVSSRDRAALLSAYKAGLIAAWKRDAERGYCLMLAGRPDEYVEVAKLTIYLERLKGAT